MISQILYHIYNILKARSSFIYSIVPNFWFKNYKKKKRKVFKK